MTDTFTRAKAYAFEGDDEYATSLMLNRAIEMIDRMAAALRERDDGRHDQHCRFRLSMNTRRCNCGHDEAVALLAEWEGEP